MNPLFASANRRSWFAALGAIAATYVFFLIFAEFALLELATKTVGGGTHLRSLLAVLGASGVAGASLAAWRLSPGTATRGISWAFLGCAAAAALGPLVRDLWSLLLVAAATGLSLGWLTVGLAASLRVATSGAQLGVCIGLGTGLAYAVCNLPPVFRAAPETQAWLAAFIAALGSIAPRAFVRPPAEPTIPATSAPSDRGTAVRWIIVLLALVWMDSAAFYIIQHEPALRAATWGSTPSLLGNAFAHLAGAAVAGMLLDRGRRTVVAVMATGALGAACMALRGGAPGAAWVGLAYVAGVSLYSVLLVEFPARDGRAALAAATYVIAGWVGSALGIGMAQDLATIPVGFVVVASVVVGAALFWQFSALRRPAPVVVACLALVTTGRGAETDPLVLRGREVYIAEGCIHCHSQFIRPTAPEDAERWGPAPALAEALAAQPPLFGTRRQGPDLTNVGNRRSLEWNRLHLITPRAISPGSRMPSYAGLFAGTAERGDALLAYLASLGADTVTARHAQISAWRPRAEVVSDPASSRRLFQQLCISCHGPEGRADGILVPRLRVPPPDWSRDAWRHVTPGTAEAEELQLARIVKFGLPGLAMAGHEYLSDSDVVGLARHVRSLHKVSGGGLSAASQP